MSKNKNYRIDNLQYCNWSKEIFQFNREAGLDAIHVTIAYHEDYDEVQENFHEWKGYFENYSELIFQGKSFKIICVVFYLWWCRVLPCSPPPYKVNKGLLNRITY